MCRWPLAYGGPSWRTNFGRFRRLVECERLDHRRIGNVVQGGPAALRRRALAPGLVGALAASYRGARHSEARRIADVERLDVTLGADLLVLRRV